MPASRENWSFCHSLNLLLRARAVRHVVANNQINNQIGLTLGSSSPCRPLVLAGFCLRGWSLGECPAVAAIPRAEPGCLLVFRLLRLRLGGAVSELIAKAGGIGVLTNLSPLLSAYRNCVQGPVRYRPSSWDAALREVSGTPTKLLIEHTFTTETSRERFRPRGDRDVTREGVVRACEQMRLDNDVEVIRAFVLVMAWGSGTTNNRSLRNTTKALADAGHAATVLRESAGQLRAAGEFDDVIDIHRGFHLPGVGEPFFTKWFAFAGRSPGRDWQPLILDSRVRATLNTTLGVRLNQLAARRNDPYRYVAYLEAVHEWSAEATESIDSMTADRLEWILFHWNGKPIEDLRRRNLPEACIRRTDGVS